MSNIADLDVDGIGKPAVLPKEGWYQARLVSQEPGTTQRGSVNKMKWQIVGATPELQNERGKYIYETLYEYSSVFFKQVALVGYALGVYSPEYLKTLQAQGKDLPMPDFEEWITRSCLVKVKHRVSLNDPDKKYTEIGFDYAAFDSTVGQATGVILDETCIEAGQSVPQANETADDF